MSEPTAKIICDSISPEGVRLTTMEVKFHRFILAEKNTHRSLSKNSASSRAIPVKKQLEKVRTDPAMPLFWGKNQSGMGAAVELDEVSKAKAIETWLAARDAAVEYVEMLLKLGLHKQLTNRLLEPFMWHTAIISGTEWENFFGQRLAINPDTNQPYAQPEMYASALLMAKAYYTHTPQFVDYGQWHLPYIKNEDWEWAQHQAVKGPTDHIKLLKQISVGRCARVSYLNHDGIRDPQEDINLAQKLAAATPMHPSPYESVATPATPCEAVKGNFRGWHQYRHEFPNETTRFDPATILNL